jgi:hypothetical protein
MHRHLLMLICSVALFAQAPIHSPLQASGILLDGLGQPVSGATVTCHLLHKPVAAQMPWALTDTAGRFVVHVGWEGEYEITAGKEEDGYPVKFWGLYRDKIPTRVTLDSSTPLVDNLVVIIGPKAGILTGSVSDAINNKPLKPHFHMWRAGFDATWIDASEPLEFRALIPSGIRMGFSIGADGYDDWNFQGDLLLSPGEIKRLDIKLIPKTP